MNKPTLFIIDDEAALIEFITDVAEQHGFEVNKFTDAVQFRKKYNNDADVIMLDLIMPEMDGIEIIQYLAEMQCNAQIILMSGYISEVLEMAQVLATGHKLNISATLSKPLRFEELNQLFKSLSLTLKNVNG